MDVPIGAAIAAAACMTVLLHHTSGLRFDDRTCHIIQSWHGFPSSRWPCTSFAELKLRRLDILHVTSMIDLRFSRSTSCIRFLRSWPIPCWPAVGVSVETRCSAHAHAGCRRCAIGRPYAFLPSSMNMKCTFGASGIRSVVFPSWYSLYCIDMSSGNHQHPLEHWPKLKAGLLI